MNSAQVDYEMKWKVQLTKVRDEMKTLNEMVDSVQNLPMKTQDGKEKITHLVYLMVHNLKDYFLEIVEKVDTAKENDTIIIHDEEINNDIDIDEIFHNT